MQAVRHRRAAGACAACPRRRAPRPGRAPASVRCQSRAASRPNPDTPLRGRAACGSHPSARSPGPRSAACPGARARPARGRAASTSSCTSLCSARPAASNTRVISCRAASMRRISRACCPSVVARLERFDARVQRRRQRLAQRPVVRGLLQTPPLDVNAQRREGVRADAVAGPRRHHSPVSARSTARTASGCHTIFFGRGEMVPRIHSVCSPLRTVHMRGPSCRPSTTISCSGACAVASGGLSGLRLHRRALPEQRAHEHHGRAAAHQAHSFSRSLAAAACFRSWRHTHALSVTPGSS